MEIRAFWANLEIKVHDGICDWSGACIMCNSERYSIDIEWVQCDSFSFHLTQFNMWKVAVYLIDLTLL